MDKEIDLMKSDERRVYGSLSSFVDWMEARKLFPHSMQNYMAGVKSYLGFQWVEIKPTYFRERVTIRMPRTIPDELPSKETILELIGGKIDPNLKALILLLSSSGLRLQEALSIRMRECTFDEPPIPRIMLAGQQTKNGQPREAYCTRQAADAIISLKKRPDDYVFSFMERPNSEGIESIPKSAKSKGITDEGYRKYMAAKKATQMLRRLVRSIGKDEKVAKGHKFHKIHFHVFRKFVFTTANHFVGSESYGHYLLGHRPYMGQYDLTTKENLRQTYAEKLERNLTIGDVPSDTGTIDELEGRIAKLEKEKGEDMKVYQDKLDYLTKQNLKMMGALGKVLDNWGTLDPSKSLGIEIGDKGTELVQESPRSELPKQVKIALKEQRDLRKFISNN